MPIVYGKGHAPDEGPGSWREHCERVLDERAKHPDARPTPEEMAATILAPSDLMAKDQPPLRSKEQPPPATRHTVRRGGPGSDIDTMIQQTMSFALFVALGSIVYSVFAALTHRSLGSVSLWPLAIGLLLWSSLRCWSNIIQQPKEEARHRGSRAPRLVEAELLATSYDKELADYGIDLLPFELSPATQRWVKEHPNWSIHAINNGPEHVIWRP